MENFLDTPYEEYTEEKIAYIENGESENQNSRYKCSLRQRWYRVP